MSKTKHLTREQIRKLLFAPMSKEEVERLREIRKKDNWLLALNLQEFEEQLSDHNYDPADDPTSVLVELETGEE